MITTAATIRSPASGGHTPAPPITAADPTIQLEHVTAGYGRRVALANVDLTVPAGSLLAVIGPNGAGKSTLLKLIAGVMKPESGTITVLGAAPGVEARSVAYVPQAEAVDWDFPVTVGEVAMMGRYARLGFGRRPGRVDREKVDAALAKVGMRGHSDRQIGTLSGGQRRRVFLARAIAAQPEVYLLDEPVSGVDATTQDELMDVLEAEARAGKTVVAATHDLNCAAQRFHQAAFVNGRIVAAGPAAMVLDRQLLLDTYGGHVLILPGGDHERLILDHGPDHVPAPGGVPHDHEGRH